MSSIAFKRHSTVHQLRVKPTIQHIALKTHEKALGKNENEPAFSWVGMSAVLVGHIALLWILTSPHIETKPLVPVQPMTVSLIAPPAPEPELVPVIAPPTPKPTPKPVLKSTPKKVVQAIKPLDLPAPSMVEAFSEPVQVEEAPSPLMTDTIAEAPKAPPKVEPVVEEAIEPPQFGVAYLKNPQPAYPAMSRRLGEEGRVLMKVLVSSDGAAKTVDIEQSSGSDRLDNAALSAVKKWRFLPARKNNQPLDAFVLVPMKFSLSS